MRLRLIPILICSILFLQGCFHTMEMSAVLSPEQQEEYMETITSQKKHFVSLAPYLENSPTNGKTAFILYVKNCGKNPIGLNTENISAEFSDSYHQWGPKSIPVISPDKLIKELERKQSRSNELKTCVRTETYCSYDVNGNPTYCTTRTVTDSLCELDIFFTSIQAAKQIDLAKNLLLQPQVLLPGEDGGGLVVCNTRAINSKAEGNFHVVVSVNGEQHEFTFNRSSHE